MDHTNTGASAEPFRFEPTVFGAVRRYLIMVIAIAVATTAAAIGYTLMQPKMYRAQASVTVPLPLSLLAQHADPGQYLDSQVVLLQSQSTAQQAVGIANSALGSHALTAGDFSASGGSLEITPPTSATAGNYGASIIGVSFTGPSARVAQVGLASMLHAYNAARTASVVTQGSGYLTGLDNAISSLDNLLASVNRQLTSPDPSLPFGGESRAALERERQLLLNQRGDLQTAQTQEVANTQAAVAQPATVAIQPATLVNHKWARAAVIGFLIGILIGGALAYALASRRRSITDRQDPAALYNVPLIGEIPTFEVGKTRGSNGSTRGADGMLPMTANPYSAAAEAFRFAAGSVERVRTARGPQLSRGLSLAFVSSVAGGGKSMVVANLALALAEGGTRVLVVDANGDLSARLLPGIPTADSFEQVLAGQRALQDCIATSPFNSAVAVLSSHRPTAAQVTGVARSKATAALLADAKASFDMVLIDTPALLQTANATEVVEAADAAIVVIGPNELIRDHREMAERLHLIGSEVVGYIYVRAWMPVGLRATGAAIFQRARQPSYSYRRPQVRAEFSRLTATAASQLPPQK